MKETEIELEIARELKDVILNEDHRRKRKRKLTAIDIADILYFYYIKGESIRSLSWLMGISPKTISRYVKQFEDTVFNAYLDCSYQMSKPIDYDKCIKSRLYEMVKNASKTKD